VPKAEKAAAFLALKRDYSAGLCHRHPPQRACPHLARKSKRRTQKSMKKKAGPQSMRAGLFCVFWPGFLVGANPKPSVPRRAFPSLTIAVAATKRSVSLVFDAMAAEKRPV